ncbi:MAG: SGNH/GDSL hydrolase family protein [Candidatus Binatia bacterium]
MLCGVFLAAATALAAGQSPPTAHQGPAIGPPRPVRIMPLGDSITEGKSGDATWRYWLQKKLKAEGCVIDYVGSRRGVLRGRPRFPDFDPDHEGHWGWTTAQVRERIDGWAQKAKPEIVLLHLGTNDLGIDPATIAENLAAIVEAVRRTRPTVIVFVARLIPAADVPVEVLSRTNDVIARMAAKRARPDSPVIVVDQSTGFDAATDTYDGVHPNESGEKKMAARWFEALGGRLECARPR